MNYNPFIDVVIYETYISDKNYNDMKIINDLTEFKDILNLIVANRSYKETEDVDFKIYSMDLFKNN